MSDIDDIHDDGTPWQLKITGRRGLPHIVDAYGHYVMDAAPRGSHARSTTRQLWQAHLIVKRSNMHRELLAALDLLWRMHFGGRARGSMGGLLEGQDKGVDQMIRELLARGRSDGF